MLLEGVTKENVMKYVFLMFLVSLSLNSFAQCNNSGDVIDVYEDGANRVSVGPINVHEDGVNRVPVECTNQEQSIDEVLYSLVKNIDGIEAAYTKVCGPLDDSGITLRRQVCAILVISDKNLYLTLSYIFQDGTNKLKGHRVLTQWSGEVTAF